MRNQYHSVVANCTHTNLLTHLPLPVFLALHFIGCWNVFFVSISSICPAVCHWKICLKHHTSSKQCADLQYQEYLLDYHPRSRMLLLMSAFLLKRTLITLPSSLASWSAIVRVIRDTIAKRSSRTTHRVSESQGNQSLVHGHLHLWRYDMKINVIVRISALARTFNVHIILLHN